MEDRGLGSATATPERLRTDYDALHADDAIHAPDRYYHWVLDLLDIKPGTRLLDIACGGGYLLRAAIRRGVEAWGVDFSGVALKQARRVAPEARIILADAEALPLETAGFDYVTNLGSLEHFLQPERSLLEMRRVLKPDGLMSIEVPNSRYVWDLARTVVGRRPTSGTTQMVSRVATLEEWRQLLERHGVRVRRAVGARHWPTGWGVKATIRRLTNPWVPLPWSYQFNFVCHQ